MEILSEPIVVVQGLKVRQIPPNSPEALLNRVVDITPMPELKGVNLMEINNGNLPGPMAIDEGPVGFSRDTTGDIVRMTYDSGVSFEEDSAPFGGMERNFFASVRKLLNLAVPFAPSSLMDDAAKDTHWMTLLLKIMSSESWAELKGRIASIKDPESVHKIMDAIRGMKGHMNDEWKLKILDRIKDITQETHPRLFPRDPEVSDVTFAQYHQNCLKSSGRGHILRACDFFRNAKFPYEPSLEPLASLLWNNDPAISLMASHAVENMSMRVVNPSQDVVTAITQVAKTHPNESVRKHAVTALDNWGIDTAR